MKLISKLRSFVKDQQQYFSLTVNKNLVMKFAKKVQNPWEDVDWQLNEDNS